MTIITKVGASYVDHMNDDVLEVDSFSRECYQALSSPRFRGESLGTRLFPSCGDALNNLSMGRENVIRGDSILTLPSPLPPSPPPTRTPTCLKKRCCFLSSACCWSWKPCRTVCLAHLTSGCQTHCAYQTSALGYCRRCHSYPVSTWEGYTYSGRSKVRWPQGYTYSGRSKVRWACNHHLFCLLQITCTCLYLTCTLYTVHVHVRYRLSM